MNNPPPPIYYYTTEDSFTIITFNFYLIEKVFQKKKQTWRYTEKGENKLINENTQQKSPTIC